MSRKSSKSKLERNFFKTVMSILWDIEQNYQQVFSRIKQMIEDGVDVNTLNERNETALMRIAGTSYIEITESLLKAGANPNLCLEGIPPLVDVALKGGIKQLKMLIEAGADVNIRIQQEPESKVGRCSPELYDRTALMMASMRTGFTDEEKKDYESTVKTLISAGADLDLRDSYGNTALMLSVYRDNDNITSILREAGALETGLNIVEFHQAVWENNLEKMKTALVSGVDINARNYQGVTALFNAISKRNIEIVRELIAAGADLDASNPDGTTPLIQAVNSNHSEIAEMLITSGANVDLKDIEGNDFIKHLKHSSFSKKERQKLRTLIQSQRENSK